MAAEESSSSAAGSIPISDPAAEAAAYAPPLPCRSRIRNLAVQSGMEIAESTRTNRVRPNCISERGSR